MTALRLRLVDSERDILVLEPGVHAVLPSALDPRAQGDDAVAHVYVDSRGVWLQVREGLRGVYVNGRPVRQMAMLRAGDSVFLEGAECALVGRRPEAIPDDAAPRTDTRSVLRAIAGRHHGRCFPLDRDCVLGRGADADIAIDDDAIGAREVTLRATAKGVRATVATPAGVVSVNGHPLSNALLVPGDQLVIAGQHRFVVEAARPLGVASAAPEARKPPARTPPPQLLRAARRLPWLMLAAVLLAAALSALLLYGAG